MAQKRVLAMGEESWRVHVSGAPSLDHLRRSEIPTRSEILSQFNLKDDESIIVVAYHPVTMHRNSNLEQHAVFDALERRKEQIVFCFPNADTGSHKIMQQAKEFCENHKNAQMHTNLPAQTYWGLLKSADLMLGNSSSGIMETASLQLPTVNIGIRQKGRDRAENIIDVGADCLVISQAIDKGLSSEFKKTIKNISNPYGDGFAAEKIVKVLSELTINNDLLFKKNIL
jgi:UDP-N-acetylglucosamine 2-epimerase (non-hydrolysing)/GDP/UDP-N,N'-diacetylbacillosamine 2-epimerase (hydrolysing)